MDGGESRGSKPTALVIGSGGVKCAAALGLWKVLRREGIKLSMAVGCSGGSLYATQIARGISVEMAQEQTIRLWTPELMKGYTSNLREVQSGTVKFTERSGLADDAVLTHVLEELFGDLTFDDTVMPLHLVAADLLTGEKVILSSGRLLDAVRASLAIPTIFPAWEVDGRLLVDGATADPLPVDVGIKEGAQVIIAIGFELALRPRIGSLTAFNTHLNNVYINNLLRSSFAFHNLAHHDEIITLVPEFNRNIGTFDTHLLPYIIEEGERTAEAYLPYLRRILGASTR